MDSRFYCVFCGSAFGTGGEASHWCKQSQDANTNAKAAAIKQISEQTGIPIMDLKFPPQPNARLQRFAQEHDPDLSTSAPVCPYCGKIDRDWWDWTSPLEDEDIYEHECGQCEKEFQVTVSINILFKTRKL
jgi:hypothetical protein